MLNERSKPAAIAVRARATDLRRVFVVVFILGLCWFWVFWRVAAVLAVGGVVGATIGVSIGAALPSVWVKRAFAALLVVVAVQLVRE